MRSGPVEIRRLDGENGMKGLEGAAARERPPTAQHLEQHHTQREEVRPRIHSVTPNLLGRHVAGGADDHAGERLRRRLHRRRFRHLQLRDAEVQDLDAAVGREKEVVGFQIAMDDAARVRGGEAAGRLQDDGNSLIDRQRALVDAAAQAFAVEAFGHEERQAAKLTDVVDGKNVRVVERAGGPGFVGEASQAIGIAREVRQQDFDRDVPAESLVFRAPHFTRAARAEAAKHRVRADAIARLDPPPVNRDHFGEAFEGRARHEVT